MTIEEILAAFESGLITLEEATRLIDQERSIAIANARIEAIDKAQTKPDEAK